MSKLFLLGAAVAAALAASPAAAQAPDIAGVWQRADGTSRIRMSPCGDAMCGTVVWLKDPETSKSRVGQQVFSALKPSGNVWKGNAFNPEDGRTYSGEASLAGGGLVTKGCALGGLVCRSVNWTRSR
jgi:uncharacterized protein (DUF2147 family)